MKNIYFVLLLCSLCLIACSPKITIPSGLSKSLVLIEKLPTDSVIKDANGKKQVVEKKVGGWVSMFNKASNKKIEKAFSSYPFDYKIVLLDEVGDHIDPNRTTYLLKNGGSNTKVTYQPGAGGIGMKRKQKTETKVILENLTRGKKSTLCTINDGVAGIAPKFVKQAKKQGGTKGKETSKKTSK